MILIPDKGYLTARTIMIKKLPQHGVVLQNGTIIFSKAEILFRLKLSHRSCALLGDIEEKVLILLAVVISLVFSKEGRVRCRYFKELIKSAERRRREIFCGWQMN